jgi:hypothetical protein
LHRVADAKMLGGFGAVTLRFIAAWDS